MALPNPDALLAAALDAALARQPAAAARLARHAGKVARLALPARPVNLLLDVDGRFHVAPADARVDLTLTPNPAALPAWLTGGGLDRLFHADGDGLFAADLAGALAAFDWVLALRPYLGDIAASRIDGLFADLGAWRVQALASAGRNLAEYAVHEQAVLADAGAVRGFVAEVDRLREDVDRLAARLALLESGTSA